MSNHNHFVTLWLICGLIMRAIINYTLLIMTITLGLFGCKSSEKRSAESFEVWGLDLSKHQRSVNWNTLIGNNRPDFVFLKATEGTLISDPTYSKRKQELNKREILCGAYHFFGHRTDGKEQAENFIKTANLKKGDLILAVGDYETTTLASLDKALRNFEPGQTVIIQIYRSRQVLELTITFGAKNTAS